MKPLFIPLKTKYFDAFAAGTKAVEYRRHGPRWNAETCQIGRPVVLSHGYGKRRRLQGVIVDFGTRWMSDPDWTECYGDPGMAACICISLTDAVSEHQS